MKTVQKQPRAVILFRNKNADKAESSGEIVSAHMARFRQSRERHAHDVFYTIFSFKNSIRRLIAVLLLPLALGACQKPEEPQVTLSFLMDTVIEQRWYGQDKAAFASEVEELLAQLEQEASPYLEGSAVARLNAAAGHSWVELPGSVFDMLRQSYDFCVNSGATGGGFDITVGPLTSLWGVLGPEPHVPPPQDIAGALSLVNYRDLHMNPATREAMLAREGQAVDTGALAKGYACDLIANLAESRYAGITGFVNVGSNVLCIGQKPNGSAYRFGIRDPAGAPQDYIGTVELPWTDPKTGNTYRILSTSGTYERYFTENGEKYCHIFDARTGKPVQNSLLSVTVMCYNGLESDYLSTDLLIRGVPGVLENLSNPGFAIIAIGEDGTVYVSDHIRQMYVPNKQSEAYTLYNGEAQ